MGPALTPFWPFHWPLFLQQAVYKAKGARAQFPPLGSLQEPQPLGVTVCLGPAHSQALLNLFSRLAC